MARAFRCLSGLITCILALYLNVQVGLDSLQCTGSFADSLASLRQFTLVEGGQRAWDMLQPISLLLEVLQVGCL